MKPYRPHYQRRADNRAAIYRAPEAARLISPPLDHERTPIMERVSPDSLFAPTPRPPAWIIPFVIGAALVAALIGVLMGFQGCGTTGRPNPVIVRWDREVDCLKDRIPEQAIGYLDVINSCLVKVLAADYLGCLVQLTEKAGRDVVACGVGFAGSEAQKRASSVDGGFEALPNASTIAAHASVYLQEDGARVKLK